MVEIAFNHAQDAKRVPLATIANTPVVIRAGYVSRLSKDLRRDDKSDLRIKDMMRHELTGIFRVKDLPPKFDSAQFSPLKVQLHKD